MTKNRVVWFIRILGYAAACASVILKQEAWALPILGALLIAEWWLHQGEVKALLATHREEVKILVAAINDQISGVVARLAGLETRVEKALQFEYLTEARHIWLVADRILKESQADDEIWSTASSPNDPTFEQAVFQQAVRTGLLYKRLLCYVDDGAENDHAAHHFTPFDDTELTGDVLEGYLGWYATFLGQWEKALKHDSSGTLANLGMKTWYDALKKLQRHYFKVFEVKSHGSEIASDYFILLPYNNGPAKAVVGFPKKKAEGMRGGLAITDSLLAKDLGLNFKRLWESVYSERKAGQDASAAHPRS